MQRKQERIDDGALSHVVIIGEEGDGFTITTEDGRPATLAVIDPTTGEVIESGADLVGEVWDVAIEAYRRFLVGEKALRVMSGPPGFFADKEPD
ncbi:MULTISPECIES: hypothetical protein [Caballeronia]|uniref:hypothetical protein n=1 Tax=Caballeronia TaxID=1827195 RepID=UPI00158BD7BA|nr:MULTISPECIES: hypothetical protein [Caballeronia]MCG7402007.1 hypothetical protein [Caballeronia zhejiangensis]MCI1042590.1 hypothetical protein [Caballeronia zhejiangensis]